MICAGATPDRSPLCENRCRGRREPIGRGPRWLRRRPPNRSRIRGSPCRRRSRPIGGAAGSLRRALRGDLVYGEVLAGGGRNRSAERRGGFEGHPRGDPGYGEVPAGGGRNRSTRRRGGFEGHPRGDPGYGEVLAGGGRNRSAGRRGGFECDPGGVAIGRRLLPSGCGARAVARGPRAGRCRWAGIGRGRLSGPGAGIAETGGAACGAGWRPSGSVAAASDAAGALRPRRWSSPGRCPSPSSTAGGDDGSGRGRARRARGWLRRGERPPGVAGTPLGGLRIASRAPGGLIWRGIGSTTRPSASGAP